MSNANTKKKMDTKKLTMLALLAALSYVVMFLSKQIPINVAGFLTFDLKDTIIVIAGFIFGPLEAMAISIVVSVIEMLTVSTTGPWGLLMNVLSTCFFACISSAYYQRHRTMKGAILGLVIGALSMTAIMLLWNYLITPIYMNMGPDMTVDQKRTIVLGMLIPTFLPFNLIKAGINGTLTMLLYKPIVTGLRRAKLIPPSTGAQKNGSAKLGVIIASFVALVTFVLLALVLAKKI